MIVSFNSFNFTLVLKLRRANSFQWQTYIVILNETIHFLLLNGWAQGLNRIREIIYRPDVYYTYHIKCSNLRSYNDFHITNGLLIPNMQMAICPFTNSDEYRGK